MKKYLLQNKPLIFLFALVIFSYTTVLVVQSFTPITNTSNNIELGSTVQSQVQTPDQVQVVEEDTPIRAIPSEGYAEVEVKYNSDGTSNLEQVLGCGNNGSNTGCVVDNHLAYQPICSRGETSIKVGDGNEVGRSGDGVKVTKNSRIEVWKITVPMALLSGSEYVKDSRMAIQSADDGFQGTFKPAYDIVTDHEARAFCVPGVNCDEFDEDIGNGPMSSYYVNVHAELNEEATNTPAPDRAVIEPRLRSACPDVQRSKPNPIKTNRKGKFVEAGFQLPGDHAHGRAFSSIQCMKADVTAEETPNHEACLEKRTSFNFLTYAIVKIEDWIDCTIGTYDSQTGEYTAPDPEQCKKSTLTSLKIDGLFGSVFKCFRNNCGIRYLDLTRQGIMPPVMAAEMAPDDITPTFNQPVVEPFYVSTPCMVRIDGVTFGDVPCIWDMSAYQADYDRQRAANIPGSEDMPGTFEEYWKMVEEQIKKRGDMCGI